MYESMLFPSLEEVSAWVAGASRFVVPAQQYTAWIPHIFQLINLTIYFAIAMPSNPIKLPLFHTLTLFWATKESIFHLTNTSHRNIFLTS